MNWTSNPNSPVWNFFRLLVVGLFLTGFLTFGYRNGFSDADYKTIIGVASALGVFDFVKKVLTLPGE